MHYDVLVVGAGISGLSAASLLAKRGLKVAVIEHCDTPGGSCGIFCRKQSVLEQGAAMLYGFGSTGFNTHQFLFNCLKEPIVMVKHKLLYTVNYKGKNIEFYNDISSFITELSKIFPQQTRQIHKFYSDMEKLYKNVLCENPSYTTPDCTNPKEALKAFIKHPLSYIKFLSYLNISTEKLLKKYFKDNEIYDFFDKLTSTYCYATVKEAPAVMASVMFVDNHTGGSYYPAGSTLFLPGILEKVIEDADCDIFYSSTVKSILFSDNKPVGAEFISNDKDYNLVQQITAENIIYSGTVWNLYKRLLPSNVVTKVMLKWVNSQIPTYKSIIYYAIVKAEAIPENTCPIVMLTSKGCINEDEITIYIMSIDDHTLCPQGQHTITAIGPSFKCWDVSNRLHYKEQKENELTRVRNRLTSYFPLFSKNILYEELATPATIEHFTLKNGGAVAGPKQMLGQHMCKRQHTKTFWNNLYCCGESTVMGTGTPSVTTSGIAAANEILKKYNLEPYVYNSERKNYVKIIEPPVTDNWIYNYYTKEEADIMKKAFGVIKDYDTIYDKLSYIDDIYGVIRRVACGNFKGAKKALSKLNTSDYSSYEAINYIIGYLNSINI